jgi:putative acyl-CoA dehydrogenase
MMCMDVRRAMLKNPSCREALVTELQDVRGQHAQFDRFVDSIAPLMDRMLDDEFWARPGTEAIARAVQGAELLRHSTSDVIDAFMKTRLGRAPGDWGVTFGSMGAAVAKRQAAAIVQRARFTS